MVPVVFDPEPSDPESLVDVCLEPVEGELDLGAVVVVDVLVEVDAAASEQRFRCPRLLLCRRVLALVAGECPGLQVLLGLGVVGSGLLQVGLRLLDVTCLHRRLCGGLRSLSGGSCAQLGIEH